MLLLHSPLYHFNFTLTSSLFNLLPSRPSGRCKSAHTRLAAISSARLPLTLGLWNSYFHLNFSPSSLTYLRDISKLEGREDLI